MSADEAGHIFYVKHIFLLLQCSFLPKFSIHIETKYEDNKGSNDSVSMMAFAEFHLILVVNGGRYPGAVALSVWEKAGMGWCLCTYWVSCSSAACQPAE